MLDYEWMLTQWSCFSVQPNFPRNVPIFQRVGTCEHAEYQSGVHRMASVRHHGATMHRNSVLHCAAAIKAQQLDQQESPVKIALWPASFKLQAATWGQLLPAASLGVA